MAPPSSFEYRINVNDQAEIARLNQRLERGPGGLVKSFAVILARESKDAFAKQAFGRIKWEPRYPNQAGAKLNIAGALMDLGKGTTIKDRRFQDRPAAVDTGTLKNSISATHGKEGEGRYFVQCGTSLPYATTQHKGGVNRIQITAAMRTNFENIWARLKEGKGKYAKRGVKNTLSRLGFLRNKRVNEYIVTVVPRPFIGITAQALDDIETRLAEWTRGA